MRRTAGWRKPDGAVVVARPTRWGNPFRAQDYPARSGPTSGCDAPVYAPMAERRRWAVTDFEAMVLYGVGRDRYPSDAEIREHLAGRDLACWCPLDGPCHADTLIKIANTIPPEA